MAFGRRFHETLAMQRNAGVGEEQFDFHPGDRVMTSDGFPGQVTAMSSGPYSGTEDYEVVLDGGMGGGTYTAGQLRKIKANTAALHEAAEVLASIPVEAVTEHTADLDYPELGTILYDRVPNENVKLAANKDNQATKPQDSQNDPGERMDQQDTPNEEVTEEDNNTDSDAAEEPADEAGKPDDDGEEGPPSIEDEKANNTPDVTPPSACSFCGSDSFEDPQMTGRGVRMRCSQCGGTMKSWGGQWEPEFPNSSQNQASGQGDFSQGGAAGVANAPGANFKTTSLDVEAGIINWVVDKIYDRIEERKNHPLMGAEWAWNLAETQGQQHYDNLTLCPDCNQLHPQSYHPNGLTIHGSLAEDYDGEWNFHFVSAWKDVQEKARRIRSEGHVKIVSASKLHVVGEVQGEHNVYESQLNYIPGTKKVADWACGCKWASYAWGRSPQYKRFEGRLCSHALALQYEANSRGMFGKEVQEDTSRPSWQKPHQPVQVQYQRPTTRAPEQDIRRRVVPPGNMRSEWAPNSRVRVKSSHEARLFHHDDPYFAMGIEHGQDFARDLERPVDSTTGAAIERIGDLINTDPRAAGQYINGFHTGHNDHFGVPRPGRMPLFHSSLDTDEIYESPELLDLRHAPIYASVREMAINGEETVSIIEMMASFDVSRDSAKGMLSEAFKVDEDGIRRDGDEYETPDGDRFNHGTPDPTDDHNDSEFARANSRDLSDHDDDPRHKHHRTNDAREHAPHWGWGLPAGVPIQTCPQCNGSGCGHCAGQGQIVSDQSMMTAGSPDQTSDAGDVASGLATNGVLHEADYSSADPLAGVDQQTYYSPTEHSNSHNPASTGWATSQDPGDWGKSLISNNFGLTTDSAKHTEFAEPNALGRCGSCGRAPVEGADDISSSTGRCAGCDNRAVPRDPYGGSTSAWYHPDQQFPGTRHVELGPDSWSGWNERLHATSATDEPTHVAGVALRAKDTGRLLMLQRSHKSENDPAAGTWEFPGGHHEDGDPTSLHAAVREFEEEVGHPFPEGGSVVHTWRSGPYRGHVVEVPSEDSLDFSQGRQIDNPDGDHHEQAAWWEPQHAKANPALRKELRSAPWDQISKASTLRDDPEEVGALPYTDGSSGDEVPTSEWPGQSGGSSGDSSLPHASTDALHTDSGGSHMIDSLHQAKNEFLDSPGAQAMMRDLGITKSAMKDFSYAEQQELINEGQGDRARNFGDLKIAGTHYEMLPDDDDTVLWV